VTDGRSDRKTHSERQAEQKIFDVLLHRGSHRRRPVYKAGRRVLNNHGSALWRSRAQMSSEN